MTVERDLRDGVVGILTGVGVTGPYYSKAHPLTPDVGIAVNVYGVNDSNEHTQGSARIQFLFRGAPNVAFGPDDQAAAVFDALQGKTNMTFGTTAVAHIYRLPGSAVSLGRDQNGRWMRADNYQADLSTPPTANRPE